MNHVDLVQQQHATSPPDTSSAAGILAFVLRVLAVLPPDERAGLLRKDGGENIVFYAQANCNVSISRVCYPDGQIYKILTDAGVGGSNGPAWNDDGTVEPARYIAVTAAPPTPVDPPVPPVPPAPPTDLSEVLNMLRTQAQALDAISGQVAAQHLAQARSFEVMDSWFRQVLAKQDRAYTGNTKFMGGALVLRPKADA